MNHKPLKQLYFKVDMALCTGCKTCMIACRDKNDEQDLFFRRVVEYVGGGWTTEGNTYRQNIFAYYLSLACNHCAEPICVESCPTTAMHKLDNGIVIVDPNLCIGCRYCEWGCPYGAPRFDAKQGIMTKCDFCADLLSQNLDPACVAACPTRALDFGELDADKKLDGSHGTVAPLPEEEITRPACILIPHRLTKENDSPAGWIGNPEEI